MLLKPSLKVVLLGRRTKSDSDKKLSFGSSIIVGFDIFA